MLSIKTKERRRRKEGGRHREGQGRNDRTIKNPGGESSRGEEGEDESDKGNNRYEKEEAAGGEDGKAES